MSESIKYFYLKLKDNFFEQSQIQAIESMKDGYLYSNILLKLYLKSLCREGKLMVTDKIPYSPEILAKITGHDVGTIEKAVNIFKQYGLIEICENGAIYMLDIPNYIGKSTTEADRKKDYRKRIEADKFIEYKKKSGRMSGHLSGHSSLELDLDLDLEKEKERPPADPAQPGVSEEKDIEKDTSFDQGGMVQGEEGPARAAQPAQHTQNSKMLFDYWNSKENLVKHRNFDTYEDKINTQLKKKHNKDIDNIKKTIDLYNDIMVDDRVFGGNKPKWSIVEFLSRGVIKFTDKTIDDFIDQVKINSKRYKSDIERKKFIENCRKGVY